MIKRYDTTDWTACAKHLQEQLCYRPLSRRLDRCDRTIQNESSYPNGGNMCLFSAEIRQTGVGKSLCQIFYSIRSQGQNNKGHRPQMDGS